MAFVWFTMRFVWPPLSKAMEERQDKIADGLAAAERGRKELELAQKRAKDEIAQAKAKALDMIEKAQKRAGDIIEEAKIEAKQQAVYQAKMLQDQLLQETEAARKKLRQEVASLVIAGTESILKREIDRTANSHFIDTFMEEI